MEEKKERVQFDFSKKDLERLDFVKEKTEAATRAEVTRRAIRLYSWFAEHVKETSIVEIQDEQGKTLYRIHGEILLK